MSYCVDRYMPMSRVPDHQVLISFSDDSDARVFEDWLEDFGFAEYESWRQSSGI